MNVFGERFRHCFSGGVFRFMVWLLICMFFLPAPLMVNASPVPAYVDDNPANAHVLRRLNSPARQAAIAEMAKQDAAARATYAQSEVAPTVPVPDAPVPHENTTAQTPAPAPAPGNTVAAVASRPQSVGEVFFNYAAGFAGVPGLAPRPGLSRGVDGSLDEGLGFHQDGTARKAGGVAGSGPSENGQRARTYMQSGLQNGYGMNGYAPGLPGLYDELHYDLWGRNDPTRGGRVSGSGAYGGGYSRDMSDFDPMSMAMDRGLNYGAGLLNSAGEAALSGLVDGGRARLNFRLDRDGYFNGEGDALLPFYDGKYTTVYTQLGARSMHDSDDTRWIGNFGLGQRWFPFAEGDNPKSGNYDAGMLMLGYNAFFDYDLTRDHQRGGIGVEAQYDWLRLASNYYFPLSDWKGSEDFDSRFVKERPAEGWDARVKAYLPFYRNVAITGAYSQWYGDHVGMFGASRLEKDPKVWSYGLEYTPVPLVSGFVNQRSTERGRTDTEFGLNFTYHFQMPWEDQISHSKVAELRTVGGSRHEFVDRENRIILEYKAKNAYRIEYLGMAGFNSFKFRILDGFDKYKAGQTVRVSASGVTLAAAPAPATSLFARAGGAIVDFFSVSSAHAADFSQTYTSDRNGEFLVTVVSPTTASITLTVQAGDNTQSFTVNVTGNGGAYGLVAASSALAHGQSTVLTLSGPANEAVTWALVSGPGTLSGEQTTTNSSGTATATLTADTTGSGPIVVRATVAGQNYECTVTIGVLYTISFDAASYTSSFSGSGAGSKASQTVTITVTQNSAPVSGATVSLTATMNDASNQAIVSGRRNQYYGFTVNSNAGGATFPIPSLVTNASGQVTLSLEDIVGERTLSLTASATPPVGSAVTAGASVAFGAGPLAAFRLPAGGAVGYVQWATNAPISIAGTIFPAAEMCGGSGDTSWTSGDYSTTTKLPTRAQLQTVSGGTGNNAGAAAGWPSDFYWTGELDDPNYARTVNLDDGFDGMIGNVYRPSRVVCRQ